jgi:hypothetical protein
MPLIPVEQRGIKGHRQGSLGEPLVYIKKLLKQAVFIYYA